MSDRPRTPDVVFVNEPPVVADALARVDQPVVGVDVERADADRYFRRAALVQVGVPGHCVLLDGVTLETMPELGEFLGRRLVILHALENDLAPLKNKAVAPGHLADTAAAAAVLGLPTGLGALLNEVLGIELDGDKSAFQRADWSQRPLPDDMAGYAAGDVVHLPSLWDELAQRLHQTGRRHWYDEELAWTISRSTTDNRSWTRVKGSGRLTPEQRAVLQALWHQREEIAREHDIAPNRLVHDETLRELAINPPRTPEQLVRRSPRRRGVLRPYAETMFAALLKGIEAEPLPKSASRRWSDTDKAVYDMLRRRRSEVAEEIGIDAGVLCPSRPLWAAVAGEPADGHALCELASLRNWQTELLAEPLWEVYVEARETSSAYTLPT